MVKTVLIPGALYDPHSPPEHSILERLSEGRNVVIAERLRYHDNVKEELTVSEQVDLIEDALGDVVGEELRIVAHSVGSVVASRLMSRDVVINNKTSTLLLAPISPGPNLGDRIRKATSSLMPQISPSEYRSREGFLFRFFQEVFDSYDIQYSWDDFGELTVVRAVRDRVFPEKIDLPGVVEVDDTHSLKSSSTQDLIRSLI